jgi:phosphoserine aminotransferase
MGKWRITMEIESSSVFGTPSAIAAMSSSEILTAMARCGGLPAVVALDADARDSLRKAKELLS